MNPDETRRQEIDWESCTFEGSERGQLRVWSRLPLEWRKVRGLPYIDPFAGQLVKGNSRRA